MSDTHELPIFWIERRNGHVGMFVGARPVGTVNSDKNLERAKMAEEMFRKIASAIGAKMRET